MASIIYVHLDCDYFFAQVEEQRDPSLAAVPMGVQQNMEVASVNYKAREFGLFNRILVTEARRLCPALMLISGGNDINAMQRYRKASQGILRCIMGALDPLVDGAEWEGRLVEQASFDDYYVEFTQRMAMALEGVLLDAAARWTAALRQTIREVTGLRCSAGVASTKLVAMLATKRAKPDGQHCASEAEGRALLDGARVASLRGPGLAGLRPSTRQALTAALGPQVRLGEVRALGERLEALLGEESTAAAEARRLLDTLDDGSRVRPFALPRSLAVELCVRPGRGSEPCTSLEEIARGFARLATMLLSRAHEDALTYGDRAASHLVAKWKLFPRASEVRQRQAPWPSASLASADAATVAEVAQRLFVDSHGAGREPFRISRLVLALQYQTPCARNRGRSMAPAQPLLWPMLQVPPQPPAVPLGRPVVPPSPPSRPSLVHQHRPHQTPDAFSITSTAPHASVALRAPEAPHVPEAPPRSPEKPALPPCVPVA